MSRPESYCVWLRHCEKESAQELKGDIKGTIPKWLEGRVTRNGPGKIQIGDTHYNHLFDSLSMLHQFNISKGQVTYRSRFLKSDSYCRNTATNRIVVTEFGTAAYPDPCLTLYQRFKNFFSLPSLDKSMSDNCVVSVLQVKDEMFALTETPFVRRVDPKSLETIGDKILLTNHIAINLATAHPHIESNGTVCNMGSSFTNVTGPCYNVIEMPMGKIEGAKVVASVTPVRRTNPSYYHSFALSQNYWVLVEQPLVFGVTNFILGTCLGNQPPSNALHWLPQEKTHFRVICRKTGSVLSTNYLADGFVGFHHVNAWEEDGHFIIDMCGTEDGEFLKMFYMHNLQKDLSDNTIMLYNMNVRRYVLPMDNIQEASVGDNMVKLTYTTCTAVMKNDGSIHCTPQILHADFFELPRINYKRNGKSYRYVYGVSTKGDDLLFERLIKLDVRTCQKWAFIENDCTVAEPIFVSRPEATDEDDGVILSTLLKKSDPLYVALLVLDAKDMKEKARVEFRAKGTVTATFHGQYVGAGENIHSY